MLNERRKITSMFTRTTFICDVSDCMQRVSLRDGVTVIHGIVTEVMTRMGLQVDISTPEFQPSPMLYTLPARRRPEPLPVP